MEPGIAETGGAVAFSDVGRDDDSKGDDQTGRYVSPTLTEDSPAVKSIRQAQVAAALEGNFELVRLLQGLLEIFLVPEEEEEVRKTRRTSDGR